MATGRTLSPSTKMKSGRMVTWHTTEVAVSSPTSSRHSIGGRCGTKSTAGRRAAVMTPLAPA